MRAGSKRTLGRSNSPRQFIPYAILGISGIISILPVSFSFYSNSNDSIHRSTEIGSNRDDIKMAYLQILGRVADEEGLKHYEKVIQDGQTINQVRTDLAHSMEAKQQAEKVSKQKDQLPKVCSLQSDVSSEDLAMLVASSHDISVTTVRKGGVEVWAEWEKNGLILAPAHFYVPLPKESDLLHVDCSKPSGMHGIDMNDDGQLQFLKDGILSQKQTFDAEIKAALVSTEPYRFVWDNCCFGGAEAQVYWSMIMKFMPKKILEVGAGWSTKLAAHAVRHISRTKGAALAPVLEAIDPYATGEFDGAVQIRNEMQDLGHAFPGFTRLHKLRVQDADMALFEALEAGDILFIDSSHCVFIGSDVAHIILEILPRIRPGVVVHFHDIFLPMPYTCSHLRDRTFWNEQYLLQGFLVHNAAWEVLWGDAWMERRHRDEYRRMALDGLSGWEQKSSFWMRRR